MLISPGTTSQTRKGFIRPDSNRCLHYYFHFLDAWFGLIYLRVVLTWAPLRLQFYCNGHSWLARKFAAEGITPWPTTPSSGLALGCDAGTDRPLFA